MKYGSDLIVDLMNDYKIPYVSMNPGATFRGIHDSIVNYAGNKPEMILCPHEKIAVQLAHGYAKTTGEPMVSIAHDTVGLLHTNLAVSLAFLDRVPLLLLGATGPMAVARRRPRLDWDHTAVVQANALRDYLKWDDQPYDLQGVVDSFARGYRIATTEPQGPVYICYDVDLQEEPIEVDVEMPKNNYAKKYTRIAPEKEAIAKAARYLVNAKAPLIVADRVGRNSERVQTLIELAELLNSPVVDLNYRFNFPNTHPLYITDGSTVKELLRKADVVLSLDIRDLHGFLSETDSDDRTTGGKHICSDCTIIDIGVHDLEINGWLQHFQRFQSVDMSILADTYVALPELLNECKNIQRSEIHPDSSVNNKAARMNLLERLHTEQKTKWQESKLEEWETIPPSATRMIGEVWEVIKNKDWVLTANTTKDLSRRLWDFDQPYRHVGKHLGTSTQIGISLGVALAHRGTGKLVVDIQPDGDLMYDIGALWVASHNKIPMLVVMNNNRLYRNSFKHQQKIAKYRGRSQETAHIGTEIDNPPPDFAGLARSLGWYAEGPITKGADIQAAVRSAVKYIEKENKPALVDVVIKP